MHAVQFMKEMEVEVVRLHGWNVIVPRLYVSYVSDGQNHSPLRQYPECFINEVFVIIMSVHYS